MQYALVITKGKNRELYKLYDNIEQAERKLNKSFKDNGIILKIPMIKAGLILYRPNGVYCYTIIKEKKTIWLLDNAEKPENIYTPILKENIINWFIKGAFKDGVEEYDNNYTMNFYKNEDEGLEEMLDEVANDNTGSEE